MTIGTEPAASNGRKALPQVGCIFDCPDEPVKYGATIQLFGDHDPTNGRRRAKGSAAARTPHGERRVAGPANSADSSVQRGSTRPGGCTICLVLQVGTLVAISSATDAVECAEPTEGANHPWFLLCNFAVSVQGACL